MDRTDVILKLGFIGWRGGLEDINSLIDWLYSEFKISVHRSKNVAGLYFSDQPLCKYYGIVKNDSDFIEKILPDILLLWKCRDGRLIGPTIENFKEPEEDWT